MIVFLAIVLALTGLLHWFLYARLVSALDITNPGLLWALRLLAVLLATSYFLARSLEKHAPEWLVHAAHWMASVWLGLMWQLLWITALFFVIKLVLLASGVWFRLEPAQVIMLGRYSALSVVVLAVLLCGYAAVRAAGPARVVEAHVPVRGLTPELRGLRIVQASDFHAGMLVRRGEISRWAKQMNRLDPDLILIPGDIVDGNVNHIIEFADAFHELAAPLGVWVTTGNHEYYAGLQASLDFYKQANLRALMNETVELPGGLILAGIEDRTARQMGRPRPTVDQLLANVPKDRPVILLNHTPESAEAMAAGKAGASLMLSGHTHAGQMWPFTLFTKMVFRFHHGLYGMNPGYILTSCGIGTWGPSMRLGAPPEIVLIRLVGESEQPYIGRPRRT